MRCAQGLAQTAGARAVMIDGSENHGAGSDEKRVLMIACAFPPTGGAGVQRTLKFAKYLRHHGWTPIVWSAPFVPHLPLDPSMCYELPSDVEHLTGPTLDPVGRSEKMFAPAIRRLSRFPRLASKAHGLGRRLGATGRKWLDLAVPDAQFFWALRSRDRLRRIIRTRRISAIFSSYSPASNHLLASWLKRSTGLPWIADFRDLWTDDQRYPAGSRLRIALDHRLERRFVREPDAVTATTTVQRDRLAEKVPDQREKFHVISNGVDFEDMDRASQRATRRDASERRDTFRLVFAGQFQSTSVTDDYFGGIGRFLAGDVGRADRFEFRIVGQVSEALRSAARKHGVHLTTTGYQPHIDAIREMMDADMLLIPVPLGTNADWCVPAKTYEYLATGRPILVVGPENSMLSRLVTCTQGAAATACRVDAIATTLREIWMRWQEGGSPTHVDRVALAPFERKALAGRLADLLDEVTHQPQRVRSADRTTVALAAPRPPAARHMPSTSVPPVCPPEEIAR